MKNYKLAPSLLILSASIFIGSFANASCLEALRQAYPHATEGKYDFKCLQKRMTEKKVGLCKNFNFSAPPSESLIELNELLAKVQNAQEAMAAARTPREKAIAMNQIERAERDLRVSSAPDIIAEQFREIDYSEEGTCQLF